MKHAYLVSSLPMIEMGAPPFLGVEDFRRQCGGVLSAEEEVELDRVLDGRLDECTTPAGQAWRNFDTQLRSLLAAVRAGRLEVDGKPYLRSHEGWDCRVNPAVVEAFARSSPLARAEVIDQVRWTRLEELANEDPFGFGAVLAYGIQLQIATRWASFDAERGKSVLNEAINTILAKAFEEKA